MNHRQSRLCNPFFLFRMGCLPDPIRDLGLIFLHTHGTTVRATQSSCLFQTIQISPDGFLRHPAAFTKLGYTHTALNIHHLYNPVIPLGCQHVYISLPACEVDEAVTRKNLP
ncbi:hypothetical protein D3C74_378910 [compost metagenome]